MFLDVHQVDDRIEYLFRQRDDWPCTTVPSAVAFGRWPLLVINFLERHVYFNHETNQNPTVHFQVTETKDPTGDPIRGTCKLNL